MRLDLISIFPEYFAPLQLSLVGKACRSGVLEIHTHDLRDYTSDRHRTVDDTPYGGGAGMVMRPEPWAQALESTAHDSASPVLIVPSPAGEVFTQTVAGNLAEENHLVFACGRYEGIDHRVFTWAEQRFRVRLISLGDYVLGGGEAAALAMIEAITRLIPGVIGNPESLVEESHAAGLLEYPVYTKPAHWRGLSVPEVLLSGHHGEIAAYRYAEQIRRTREVRPELLPAEDKP